MAALISSFYQTICKRPQRLLWRSPVALKGLPKPCAACCCGGCPRLSAPCSPRPFFLISSSLSTGKETSLHHLIRLCRRNKAELSNPVTQTRTALHSARAVLWWIVALEKRTAVPSSPSISSAVSPCVLQSLLSSFSGLRLLPPELSCKPLACLCFFRLHTDTMAKPSTGALLPRLSLVNQK